MEICHSRTRITSADEATVIWRHERIDLQVPMTLYLSVLFRTFSGTNCVLYLPTVAHGPAQNRIPLFQAAVKIRDVQFHTSILRRQKLFRKRSSRASGFESLRFNETLVRGEAIAAYNLLTSSLECVVTSADFCRLTDAFYRQLIEVVLRRIS